jgi:hypothetical protein
MYAIVRHFRELVRSPYYRSSLRDSFFYPYAKWVSAHGRVESPERLLTALQARRCQPTAASFSVNVWAVGSC